MEMPKTARIRKSGESFRKGEIGHVLCMRKLGLNKSISRELVISDNSVRFLIILSDLERLVHTKKRVMSICNKFLGLTQLT